jgi:hypothetical protein
MKHYSAGDFESPAEPVKNGLWRFNGLKPVGFKKPLSNEEVVFCLFHCVAHK